MKKIEGLSIQTVGRFTNPLVRIRRTSSDSDMIICERNGDDITYCRDRYPLNVWAEDHFVNIPWFMRQPGFDIEIDIGRKR